MSWVAIIALAAAALAAAIVLLRLPRGGWTLFAATLLFGLAGYAVQGSPGMPAAPKAARADQPQTGEQMVTARRQFFETGRLPPRWTLTADAFARRGDYARAAEFYRIAVEQDPQDQEGWLALGMALIEHAEGNLTPAATYAFERAREIAPGNGGAQYFLGLVALNRGELARTLELWRDALRQAPPDAPWRAAVAFQTDRLGEVIRMQEASRRTTPR